MSQPGGRRARGPRPAGRQGAGSSGSAVVVYDGECGFCSAAVAAIGRRLALRATPVAWQSAELTTLGVTEDEARVALQYVDGERRGSGAEAVALWLGTGPWSARAAGRLLRARPVLPLASVVYRFVARHRGRIPGPWKSRTRRGAASGPRGRN